MEQEIIRTEGLCYQSGRRFLVDHVDWRVNKGEHWLVFGLNGCGKTTLLSMICGYRSPTAGKVQVFGQYYDENNVLALRRRIGLVSSSFFDKYYGQEPSLNIVLSGLSGTFGVEGEAVLDADVRRAKRLLKELRVDMRMNMPFHLLSKGERQDVLIARALLAQPEILVLDEPCTGLDIYAQAHMMDTICKLATETDVTIIYVTHQPEEIRPFLDKTLLMRNGHVFALGDTQDMISSTTLSALLSEPVAAQWHDNGRLTLEIQAPSKIASICYDRKEETCNG